MLAVNHCSNGGRTSGRRVSTAGSRKSASALSVATDNIAVDSHSVTVGHYELENLNDHQQLLSKKKDKYNTEECPIASMICLDRGFQARVTRRRVAQRRRRQLREARRRGLAALPAAARGLVDRLPERRRLHLSQEFPEKQERDAAGKNRLSLAKNVYKMCMFAT